MGPLDGVKVIEIAGLSAAPFGCMLLADLGADIVRIERRGRGDAVIRDPSGLLDRGRRTISVDLKSDAGRELVIDLARAADVLVEGFRPGVAERLGIGPDVLTEVNPRLVYARVTGWGQTGPSAQSAGHDINFISVTGVLDQIGPAGQRPVPPLNLVGDLAGGGMFMALGVLAAIVERTSSGRGQVLDVAMVDGAAVLMSYVHALERAGTWSPRGEGALHGGAPFYRTYETSDGRFLAVGCVEPPFYREFLAVVEAATLDPADQFDTSRWDAAHEVIAAILRARTRDEWMTVFAGTDACVSPVLSPDESWLDPHLADRGTFYNDEGVPAPTPAPRFGRSAAPMPKRPRAVDPADVLSSWAVEGR